MKLVTKAARRATIVDLLAGNTITSQEQLKESLSVLGIETTQATLSRDLLEMQATKVRDSSGNLVYTVPDINGELTHDFEASQERLQRWCQDLLVRMDMAGNLLVIKTPVGAANLLASALDSARMRPVAGTIAGDDTVLVICHGESECSEVQSTLLRLVTSDKNSDSE